MNIKKNWEGVFLGFDFGSKYIGVAVGQTVTLSAQPLLSLKAHNGIPQWEELGKIIQEWQPKGLVVGLALQLDGSSSATSVAAQKFAKRLHKHFNLPIFFVEERLTTVAARERLREQYPTTFYQKDVDAMSAAIILETWLHSDSKEIAIDANSSTIG